MPPKAFSNLLVPPILIDLRLQNPQGKTIELRHQHAHTGVIDQLNVLADPCADNAAQALVILHRGREGVVGGRGELGRLPEVLARAGELLFGEVFEPDDIVLVANLIHLSVGEELRGGAVECGQRCV